MTPFLSIQRDQNGGVMLMLQCKLKCRPLIMNITEHINVNTVHGTVLMTLSIKTYKHMVYNLDTMRW